LRTGDLGFIDEGEVFVAGRLKDLVIVRGRNHYPQDIELTVEKSHASLRPGCGAAVSMTVDDQEELLILQEARESKDVDFAEVAAAIRRSVAENHGVTPCEIAILPPRTILKTSSGKIARRPCREALMLGQLPIVFRWRATREPGTTDSQAVLSNGFLSQIENAVASVLKLPPSRRVTPDADLYDLGMDSASAAELLFTVEKLIGRKLSIDLIAKARTPAQIVDYLKSKMSVE
jgi:acyl carrier protein